MSSDGQEEIHNPREAAAHCQTGGGHLIKKALRHLQRVLPSGGGTFRSPPLARQKACLREWANGLGLLLEPASLFERLQRGGQEHDIALDGDRVLKATRNGIFGLTPGLELSLISGIGDNRRFHLWEATPMEYLERLWLQNRLVPGLNSLEGILAEEEQDGEIAIVIAQPRFDFHPVTQPEIDAWFADKGFRKITASGYYRAGDNLGVFDAHDRNVLRFERDLIPFDVIPCRPGGGFLQFIENSLAGGQPVVELRRLG